MTQEKLLAIAVIYKAALIKYANCPEGWPDEFGCGCCSDAMPGATAKNALEEADKIINSLDVILPHKRG